MYYTKVHVVAFFFLSNNVGFLWSNLFILLLFNFFQLEPHVNGPFTPDLATPISQLGRVAKENGWPLDVKVGK